MTRILRWFAVAALGVALAGCFQGTGQKEMGGALLGAAGGGLLGSQFGGGSGQLAATAAGVFLGGLIGQQVGQSLDRADRAYAAQAYQRTLETAPSGQTTSWSNPDSGNYGTYTPQRTFQAADGRHCREFQQTINVGGVTETGYGTACRRADGSWEIVSQ